MADAYLTKIERVAIIGSRKWTDRAAIASCIDALSPHAVILTGCCPTGVDQMVFDHCMRVGRVCTRSFAPWDVVGLSAGPKRNGHIAQLADRVIAYDQGGPGTRNCVGLFRAAGKPVEVRRS